MGGPTFFSGRLFEATGSVYDVPQHPIGSGTEHLVLNSPYFDRLDGDTGTGSCVIRCSIKSLRECNFGTYAENVAAVTALAAERNARYDQLRGVFGREMVPWEETGAYDIFLWPEDVSRVWPDGSAPKPEGIFSLTITWQDKVRELDAAQYDQRDVFGLTIPYAELQGAYGDVATYAAVHDRWVTHADKVGPLQGSEFGAFQAVQRSPWLARLLHEAEWRRNTKLRTALGHMVAKSIAYSRQYGQILDYMGENNGFVTRDGTAKLVDGLIPVTVEDITELPGVIEHVAAGEPVTRWQAMRLLNGLGYVRSMNFLAAFAGISDRLPVPADVEPSVWYRSHNILTSLKIAVPDKVVEWPLPEVKQGRRRRTKI